MEGAEGNQDGNTPGTYGSTGGGGGSKKLQQTHAQVNEVVDIMRENVEKVIDRDIKLSELDDRADALQQGASQFETQAAKLKRKYWWKNMKMWILLIAVGLLVVVIIFVSQSSDKNANSNSSGTVYTGPPVGQQPAVGSPTATVDSTGGGDVNPKLSPAVSAQQAVTDSSADVGGGAGDGQ